MSQQLLLHMQNFDLTGLSKSDMNVYKIKVMLIHSLRKKWIPGPLFL